MDENYVQLRDHYIREQLGELELTPEQREAEFQRIRLLDDDGVRDALEELAGEGEDEFDPLQYVASNPDLIATIGADEEAAERHWEEIGKAEGRAFDDFDPEQYLKNYPDLQAAFGTDVEDDKVVDAATRHYIRTGFFEGRNGEELEPLQYIASHEDLIRSIGIDEAAGERHWVTVGLPEGREIDEFDEEQYLENYPDLRAAFGADTDAATRHYIQRASSRAGTARNSNLSSTSPHMKT